MLAEFKIMSVGLACSGLGGVGQGIGQIFSSFVETVALFVRMITFLIYVT